MRTFTVEQPTYVTDTTECGGTVERVVGTTEKVYRGFDRNYSSLDLDHVVLLTMDGELDVWAVDNPNKVSDLIRYLCDEEAGEVKLLGCYTRQQALTTVLAPKQ